MPVYNGETYLRAAIDPLLAQTYRDFELVISDNASTDATEPICRAYAEADPRVRYYRNPENVGASDNYNRVFRLARGIYFKWASSNDHCEPTFLEKCVAVLEQRADVVVAYPRTRLMRGSPDRAEDYEDGLDLQEESACLRFRRFLERVRLNNVMNGVIRAEALASTHLVKPFFWSDVNMMAELTLYGKFVEVPEYLFYRRMEQESTTALKKGKDLLAHYDPNLKRRMLFQHWKVQGAYLSSAVRARLPLREKICLYAHLGRRLAWSRRDLAYDLYEALRLLASADRGGSGVPKGHG